MFTINQHFRQLVLVGLLLGASTGWLTLRQPASAAPPQTVILMLGDSLTEGTGIVPERAYPRLVEQQLRQEGYSVKVINAGIGGSTTASAPARLRWHLRAKPKPAMMLLALGPNDGMRGVPVQQSQRYLAQTIEIAQGAQLRVVLAGMKIPPNYGAQYSSTFAAMYPALAQKYQLPLVPFLLQGVAAQPKLNLADGIHPNEAGHQILARNVLPYLRPLLKK
jgi:acyl-CoA thioesterase-1